MPVRDFLLEDGDLAVAGGDFALAGGESAAANNAAVRQSIQIRTQFFLGEWFLDEGIGVDWIGSILVKNPNLLVVRELLRAAIVGAPDVIDAKDLGLTIDSHRRALARFAVRTVYSTTPLLVEVASP